MSASLGSYLRELRQQRGVSIDEISRITRIPPRYLEALEQDDLGVLPAPVFIRGFVRAYCQAVGELPDEALSLYEPPKAAAPAAPSRSRSGPRSNAAPVLVSFVLLVVFGAALGGVTLLLQSGRPDEVTAVGSADGVAAAVAEADPEVATGPDSATADAVTPGGDTASARQPEAPAPVAAAQSASKPAAPSSPAAPTPSASPPTASTAESQPPIVAGAVTSPYRLVARATEATWIRVRTGDGRTIEETIPAGQTREWVSDRPFILTVGNAGGVVFELNGEKLPVLGAPGAVIQRLVLPSMQQ